MLVSGADFYSTPSVSPDGTSLAWLQWNHPNMPWDGTELWVAAIAADGSLGSRMKVAGGPDESIFQPSWSPDGRLYFVSDRTGWWNLYRAGAIGASGATGAVGAVQVRRCDRHGGAEHRGDASDGGRVREAAVDLQRYDLCVHDGDSHRRDLHRGWALEDGAARNGSATVRGDRFAARGARRRSSRIAARCSSLAARRPRRRPSRG